MTLYIVKHIATGFNLPQSYMTGGSFWDPTKEINWAVPRVFHSKQAAASFISQWVRGEHHTYRSKGDWTAGIEPSEDTVVKDVGRTRSMLRAVPIEIREIEE
jgi:hypothetical protein